MQQDAILVACGSFSPITYAHLRMFELARDHLRTLNYSVTKGILSPVSDHYVKKDLTLAKHRMHMCCLATMSSEWIHVDDWECSQIQYTPTARVLEHFQDMYPNAKIFYLVGADLAATFCNVDIWEPEDVKKLTVHPFGTVVIERPGTEWREYEQPFIRVPSVIQNDVSSTKVRKLVREGKSIRYLTPLPVVKYISTYNLWT